MATYSVADPVKVVGAIDTTSGFTVPANHFAIIQFRMIQQGGGVAQFRINGFTFYSLNAGSTEEVLIEKQIYIGPGQTADFNLTSGAGSGSIRIFGVLFSNSTAS